MYEWNWYQDTINVLVALGLLLTQIEFNKIKKRLKEVSANSF